MKEKEWTDKDESKWYGQEWVCGVGGTAVCVQRKRYLQTTELWSWTLAFWRIVWHHGLKALKKKKMTPRGCYLETYAKKWSDDLVKMHVKLFITARNGLTTEEWRSLIRWSTHNEDVSIIKLFYACIFINTKTYEGILNKKADYNYSIQYNVLKMWMCIHIYYKI